MPPHPAQSVDLALGTPTGYRLCVTTTRSCAGAGQQARPQIEERDDVVAWNGQRWRPQAVHERACRVKMGRTSAPRDAAGQHLVATPSSARRGLQNSKSARRSAARSAASTTSRFACASLLPAAVLMTNCSVDVRSISGRAASAQSAFRSFPASNALQRKCRWRRARR